MLEQEFKELESYFPYLDVTNPQVSKAGIAWHCDHILRATLGICVTCIKSEEADYQPHFNFYKWLVLTLNYFPRGRAKAPKSTQSEDPITLEALEKLLAKCNEKLVLFEELPAYANFKHPIFGYLNKKESQKFLKIHLNHHLKIMREIKGI